MMNKLYIFAAILAFGMIFMGCAGPSYQPCCIYDNATNDTNPICDGGLDPETGYPLVWELAPEGCDEEAWACKVYAEDSEGNQLFDQGSPVIVEVPICPRLKEVQCNTTCAGVFCGSFNFDPRPSSAAVSGTSSYATPTGEEEDEDDEDEGSSIPPSPIGLWHAECSLQNITPLFLRHIENSESITLNTLRFGVGNSFQDFEDAQYYFPLTDRACALNPMGEVDRYILYAIPNLVAGGEDLCQPGGIGDNCEYYRWICKSDDSIYSNQYFDCASRCALALYGYAPEIEAFNPYTTLSPGGELVGNPFSYGLDRAILGDEYNYISTKAVPVGGGSIETYRGVIETINTGYSSATYRDEYQYGTNLYGATFGWNGMSYNSENNEYLLLPFFAKNGPSASSDESFPLVTRYGSTDYYAENEYTNDDTGGMYLPFLLDWSLGSTTRSSTVFLTAENDPHQIYPWLLTHHSVYNRQIRQGYHYLMNGSTTGGAEFECTSSKDCISGFCSTEDYSRGACLDIYGGEIDCGCTLDTTGSVCEGSRAYWTSSWDQPDDDYHDVVATVPLSAAVSYFSDPGEDLKANAGTVTMLPSTATVEVLPVGWWSEDIPVLIFSLGGSQRFFDGGATTGGAPLPDYQKITKSEMIDATGRNARCAFLEEIINPTSAGIVYEPQWECFYDQGDVCEASQWVAGNGCTITESFGTSGNTYTISSFSLDDYTDGGKSINSNTIFSGYMINMLDGEFWYESFSSGTSLLGACALYAKFDCNPTGQEICSHSSFLEQANRLLPQTIQSCFGSPVPLTENEEEYTYIDGKNKINSFTDPYLVTTSLCFSRSAQAEYGLPVGFAHSSMSWEYEMNRYPNFVPLPPFEYDVCKQIDLLADEDFSLPQYRKAFCYQWASGGRKALSDADVCVAESLAILVVTPRIIVNATPSSGILPEYEGRLAFGDCLINEQENDLDLKSYGVCEGCGYLTMAKEHLVALPDDVSYGTEVDGYYSTYCPDMVVSTPQPDYSISDAYSTHSTGGIYDWMFLRIAPYEMGGFVNYQYGNNDRDASEPSCVYPNGVDIALDESEAANPYRGLPYVLPNAYYINSKLESMMKRNIQPVIFADGPSLWKKDFTGSGGSEDELLVLKLDSSDAFDWSTTAHMRDMLLQRPDRFIVFNDEIKDGEYYYLTGSFLANTLFNEGGLILVSKIAGSQETDFDGAESSCGLMDADCDKNIHSDIKLRGISTRVLCPNCMNAVAVGYDDSGSGDFDNTIRLNQIATIFGYGNASTGALVYDPEVELSCGSPEITCNSYAMDYLDAIAVKVELKQGDEYCSLSGEERYNAIVMNLSQIGTNSLKRYGKPVVITDLVIYRSGTCWDEATAGEFMIHLGLNSVLLAKSGVLGIIYGDWESTTSEETGIRFDVKDSVSGYRGDFYKGVFIASRNIAGYRFQTLYNEVPVMQTCPCEPCTASDPPWKCNGRFMGSIDAPLCEGYIEGSNMKWQEMCITQDTCMNESTLEESTINCEILYNNGSTKKVSYAGTDIVVNPGLYKDVLASVIAPRIPCFSTEGTNLSFGTLATKSYSATPSVFSLEGNTSVRCDPTEGIGEICGYVPPISDYEMSCTVTKGSGIWFIETEHDLPCGGGEPPLCSFDSDCPQSYYCNEWGQCSNLCIDDSYCPQGAFCNLEEWACTTNCVYPTDCAPGQDCTNGICTGEAIGCVDDEECGPDPAFCQSGACYYPCDEEVCVTVLTMPSSMPSSADSAVFPKFTSIGISILLPTATTQEVCYEEDEICQQHYHLPDYTCSTGGTQDGYCVEPVIIE